jgi:iron-sulfur cluster repair protein YtfE (RIC family)
MVSDQFDLYTNVHKGQRMNLFNLGILAGTIDYSSQKSIGEFYNQLLQMKDDMHLHATLEETCIHPLLTERVPEGAKDLEKDHQEMRQRLDSLVAHFESIRAKRKEFERSRELELEFYRALNRFNAFYLIHIDKEEEIIHPTLWSLCTDKEMRMAFSKVLRSQTPQQTVQSMKVMLPAANLGERIQLFMAAKPNMPPQVFQSFLKLAEQVLTSDDWKALKARLGVWCVQIPVQNEFRETPCPRRVGR